MNEPAITANQLSVQTGHAPRTIGRWLSLSGLPFEERGGRRYYARTAALAVIEECKKPAAVSAPEADAAEETGILERTAALLRDLGGKNATMHKMLEALYGRFETLPGDIIRELGLTKPQAKKLVAALQSLADEMELCIPEAERLEMKRLQAEQPA